MRATLTGKIVFIRIFKLGHIPPAVSAAQMIVEAGLPVIAFEFGNREPSLHATHEKIERLRLDHRWLARIPERLQSICLFWHTFAFLALKILREGKPRLLVGNGLPEQCIVYGLSIIFGLRYALNIYEVYQKEDRDLSTLNRVFFALERFCLRRAEWLVFNAHERLEIYRERYRLQNPCYTVFNATPRRTPSVGDSLGHRLRLPPDAVTLLYIGGLEDLNCIAEGVQAVALVPRVHFILAGWVTPAYRARLESIAREANCIERVHFVGTINSNKWDWIDNADLGYCVYRPSWLRTKFQATSSNKFMEYIAAGIPMVAGITPDFKEVVDEHQVGIAVTSSSPEVIAAALTRLVESASLRAEMRRNCLALHQREFNFEHQFVPVLKRFQEHFPQAGNNEEKPKRQQSAT